jgi:hypothetical protein
VFDVPPYILTLNIYIAAAAAVKAISAQFFEQQRVMLVLVLVIHGAWPCTAMCVAGRQHML